MGQSRRFLRTLDFAQDRGEFVAAQPRNHVDFAQGVAEALRHGHQQRVSEIVAKRVVHVLEAVEIDEQHADLVFVAGGARNFRGELLEETAAIRQLGELVVAGEITQQGLVALAIGDVLDDAEMAKDRTVFRHLRQVLDLDALDASLVVDGIAFVFDFAPGHDLVHVRTDAVEQFLADDFPGVFAEDFVARPLEEFLEAPVDDPVAEIAVGIGDGKRHGVHDHLQPLVRGCLGLIGAWRG